MFVSVCESLCVFFYKNKYFISVHEHMHIDTHIFSIYNTTYFKFVLLRKYQHM